MSNVTSNSELTTKEIVEQAIQDYHNTILPYLAKGNNGYSETPIGAIQFFDDDTAPSGWLVADGTIYNISDYPFLANHYERVHGSKNHYGGDGVTTFAVPDWRGEFFRASGPNAHPNQGDGAAVGEHQDATISYSEMGPSGANNIAAWVDANHQIGNVAPTNLYDNANYDYIYEDGNSMRVGAFTSGSTGATAITHTSRPTCTSGLCCIKAVPAGINYSLREQEIGTWIDGKKVYKKSVAINQRMNWQTGGLDRADLTIVNPISNMERILDAKAEGILYGNPQFANIDIAKSNNNLQLYAGDNIYIEYLTLYYTKTD